MVCVKLKAIYHTDKPWGSCYQDVSSLFSKLKKVMRPFYGTLDNIDLLKELNKYTNDDIIEAMEHK